MQVLVEKNLVPRGALSELKEEAKRKGGQVLTVKVIGKGWIEVKILYTVEQ